MSRVYICTCNRCGKAVGEGGLHFPKEITEDYTDRTVDFCEECTDSFIEWLHEDNHEGRGK